MAPSSTHGTVMLPVPSGASRGSRLPLAPPLPPPPPAAVIGEISDDADQPVADSALLARHSSDPFSEQAAPLSSARTSAAAAAADAVTKMVREMEEIVAKQQADAREALASVKAEHAAMEKQYREIVTDRETIRQAVDNERERHCERVQRRQVARRPRPQSANASDLSTTDGGSTLRDTLRGMDPEQSLDLDSTMGGAEGDQSGTADGWQAWDKSK
eukprot:TRINITY_DN64817_c0_g1_i1.p1 TRINITY_DN64817_c0_g1~~TRINITY_DN64817_c0_g1_i1.p1  ORF type:complete len:239 (-),score=45.14 TRINITY_DN64817_c0_g1_i1:79-726(-)